MKHESKSLIRSSIQKARAILIQETKDQLNGIYGIKESGSMEPLENLPKLTSDESKMQTRLFLERWFDEEEKSGLKREDALQKLLKETAFTHINRLVAFKMMEARSILRGTINRGIESNGFKFYLADHPDDLKLYESGHSEEAYQNFLLWQCGQIAEKDHMEVLFDPENLPSMLFPRPQILQKTLKLLNVTELDSVWIEDETIGWVYQYFIEEDKDKVFNKIYQQKKKMELRDIPMATQIFTPRWIVEYLVQNTLGRLWLRIHPDSKLQEHMKYYVPNPYNDTEPIPKKPVTEITLLDPACGTMHFGMVAFDLFYKMYEEEIENAGKPGWFDIEDKRLKIKDKSEIPILIIEKNLYGIDIDLRAIQLSALSLYLKSKTYNKNARINKLNLTYTDIPPIPENEINEFVDSLELSHPIAEELLKEILPELNKAYYLGSLLKIEETVESFIKERKRDFEKLPLISVMEATEEYASNPAEFWLRIHKEILNGLKISAENRTNGKKIIAGESIQGIGLIDALVRKHDIVVCNPPYSGRRNWSGSLSKDLKELYPKKDGDLYTVFTDRVYSLTSDKGFCGLVTIHSFMFTSSHVEIRKLLINKSQMETMAHLGTRTEFDVANKTAQGFSAYAFEKLINTEKSDFRGIYFRLIKENEVDKRYAFEKASKDWQTNGEQVTDQHVFVVRQEDFKAIQAFPFVYWISNRLREIFFKNKKVQDLFYVALGMTTSDNFRVLRYIWEIGYDSNIYYQSLSRNGKWFLYMKGGDYNKWYGNQEHVVNWENNGIEIQNMSSYPRAQKYYFKEGATYSFLTVSNLSVRYLPLGFIFDVAGSSIFPKQDNPIFLIALLNSKISTYLIKLLNPTVNYQVGDIARLPYPNTHQYPQVISNIEKEAQYCIHLKKYKTKQELTSWEFIIPVSWNSWMMDWLESYRRLTFKESQISEMVYHLYGVDDEDIQNIEQEFGSLPNRMRKMKTDDPAFAQSIKKVKTYFLSKHIPEEALKSNDIVEDEEESDHKDRISRRQSRYLNFEEICLASGYHPNTVFQIINEAGWERPEERWETAYNWLEYAIGILMGRFKPGQKGELGSAIIHKIDFITGSLTITDEEFEEIIQYFPVSYIDEQGKHAFLKDIEQQLCSYADPDGIMVLDEGHPDDLPSKIEEVLTLMLGEHEAQQVLATIIEEKSPNKVKFRKFMERDFFSKHHLKLYRKRPIYWLLQTTNKNYGFYISHERIDKDTLFKLQKNYIDPKLNLIDQQLREISGRLGKLEGREYRLLAKEKEQFEELYQEIQEFSEKLNNVLNLQDENGKVVGYDPDINDGIILNMAPLHELIPWNEPLKYWKELQEGKYDWAHMAMRYWSSRVLDKCKKDKSLRIAHGLEE